MRSLTFTSDNKIDLLHCGAEYFPALIAAFDAAAYEIYLETYIFELDQTGLKVVDALKRAAGRGVTVNVITDWIGTGRVQSAALHQLLKDGGVHHRSFNPWFRGGVARTHRKICVVDRKLAFLGGLNINNDLMSDDDARTPLPAPRWDFAVRISGPLVPQIHQEVHAQWLRVNKMQLKARWEKFKQRNASIPAAPEGSATAALIVRDNLRNRRAIQRAYLLALGRARESAWLANPYFAPGRKLRRALAAAARRGVKVTLLLGAGQYRIQDAVTHWFYPRLLKSGVRVVEYRKTQLHGKVAVIDDEWATVGSSNCDGFSLFVNQEANVVVQDHEFACKLRADIERAVAEGMPVDANAYTHLPWQQRVWHAAAYLVYRTVLRVITLGKYTE